MRVISFVPSWTETFIEAGVQVVGRTRFCIHPDQLVKNIDIVGGTKNIFEEKVLALKPDFIIFDKEENNKSMADFCESHGLNWIATHVVDLQTCGEELIRLGEILKNDQLVKWGQDYLTLLKLNISKDLKLQTLNQAVLEGSRLNSQKMDQINTNFQYVIWKKPFMVVNHNTFIGDVLNLLSVKLSSDLQKEVKKYPEIADEDLKKYFCLFSSEPYPFAKDFEKLLQEGFSGVLVDGEKISWYGIRNLKFLGRF